MASIFRTRTSLLALDLTGAGAPAAWQRAHDPETENFVLGRLAGLAGLADKAGADLITLGASFRLGGERRRDAWLDGALAASRLGRHTRSAHISAAIPLGVTDAGHVASAVTSVHRATAARGGWQIEAEGRSGDARSVDAVLGALGAANKRTGATTARPLVVANVRSDVDLEIAAARADVARLRVATLEEARLARAAIRQAAQDWGRDADDVKVLVDVRTILAGDRREAQARADLLTDLEGAPAANLLHTVGTPTDLATQWANWVRAGAADGFTVIPASVPTDVIALAGEVVPELRSRGLLGAAPAATPVAAPAAPVHAPARRKVGVAA